MPWPPCSHLGLRFGLVLWGTWFDPAPCLPSGGWMAFLPGFSQLVFSCWSLELPATRTRVRAGPALVLAIGLDGQRCSQKLPLLRFVLVPEGLVEFARPAHPDLVSPLLAPCATGVAFCCSLAVSCGVLPCTVPAYFSLGITYRLVVSPHPALKALPTHLRSLNKISVVVKDTARRDQIIMNRI